VCKGRSVRKADNLTAIYEPIFYMWEPQRLTILWTSTTCYRDSIITLSFPCARSRVLQKKLRLRATTQTRPENFNIERYFCYLISKLHICLKISVCRNITMCVPVKANRRFGATWRLHFQVGRVSQARSHLETGSKQKNASLLIRFISLLISKRILKNVNLSPW
jgi:hypothetical protein